MSQEQPHGMALCAGIGGLERGLGTALRAGCRTVAYVEREAFCVSHLARQMEAGELAPAPIWDDVTTFDGRQWRGRIQILTAGYPCQPFSAAGKRRRLDDDRWIWEDVARIIRETKPLTCFFENTPHHAQHGLSQVVSDLESMGYSVACGLFRASDVGLPHKRERLFILAHAHGVPLWQLSRRSDGSSGPREDEPGFDRLKLAHADCGPEGWPEGVPQPGVCRGADGIPGRTHRLRALGNAVIPAVAELAFRELQKALAA
jgi:DNA (cytosine-5)-methyltransferase 1